MNRPYVVCHMLCSLDGKIDGAYMTAAENEPVRKEYGNLRNFYQCQATLYGTVTMEGSYSDGLVSQLPFSDTVYPLEDYVAKSEVQNYIVSVDPKGTLAFPSSYIEKKGRPKAHIIEILTQQVSNEYLAYLRKLGISYLFAGRETIDCKLTLFKLHSLFHIDRLMLAGGGFMNGSFLQEDLIDEISLVISPLADGNTSSVSIFERADFYPEKKPTLFALKAVQQVAGDGLWLRYTYAG